MGTVYINSTEIGTFSPTVVGTSGTIYINGYSVGTFTLAESGLVYIGSIIVGTYTASAASIADTDARYRTKIYLETYLVPTNLTKDDDVTLVEYVVMYANPPYPLIKEFKASSAPVDLVYCVSTAETEALPLGVGYIENVPITIWCVDKPGITGTKLRWKAEVELRRVTETHPSGSLRSLSRVRDNEQNLGGIILYSITYILRYKRYS